MIAKILYPESFTYGLCNYQPIIDHFGTVAVQVDDHNYQGDTRVLYQDFSYLQFGWGSCSGCDALQACNSHKEIEELIDSLRNSIKRFSSAQEALDYFLAHDWEGDYSFNRAEQKEFVEKSIEYLRKVVGG